MMAEGAFDRVLAAAQAGDGAAFGELYEAMQRRVYAFAAVRGASDAEGIVNDVFLRVFTKITTFVGNEAQFSGWVFAIARNRLIDEARQRARRVEESELHNDQPVTDALVGGDVEDQALARSGDQWVHAQLNVLTAEQRDVVVLRVVSGLTIEEIAAVMGKRVGAIKALQRRALRTLARNIDREAVPR